jgi:hypothetical protein
MVLRRRQKKIKNTFVDEPQTASYTTVITVISVFSWYSRARVQKSLYEHSESRKLFFLRGGRDNSDAPSDRSRATTLVNSLHTCAIAIQTPLNDRISDSCGTPPPKFRCGFLFLSMTDLRSGTETAHEQNDRPAF